MNVFEFSPLEVAEMDYDNWINWRSQWILDFQRISTMIRMMKAQTACLAQMYDTIDNSSFIAAGRCISQRNLLDCRQYAHSLMELLAEVKVQRNARRIVERWKRESEEDAATIQGYVSTAVTGDDVLARQIFNTLNTNRAVAQALTKLMTIAVDRMENDRIS